MVLPTKFTANINNLIDDNDDFFKSLDEPFCKGVRLNTLKASRNLFSIDSSLERVPWCTSGYYYNEGNLSKSPLYSAGAYYFQEPSAMLPAAALPIEEHDFVLDICAAPGGKTTFIGEKLNGSGLLVSNDISHSRCAPLLKNIERHGIKNACVLNEDSSKLKTRFPNFFDKILLDAPCSGEGMFRKDPKAIKSWESKNPDYYSTIQQKLLSDSAEMLKPGGILSYSTCTFNTTENEEIIEDFLNTHHDFEPYFVDHTYYGASKGLNGLDFCLRIWPHRQGGEGHFLALLRKKGCLQKNIVSNSGLIFSEKNANFDAAMDFITENITDIFSGSIVSFKDSIILNPEFLPDLKGIRVFRSGLSLGNVKKNRFEPEQALAMVLNRNTVNNYIDFDIDDNNIKKYLRGESIDIAKPKGWYLVCICGLSLGWAKSDGIRLKNKLSNGWINN